MVKEILTFSNIKIEKKKNFYRYITVLFLKKA